MWNHSQVLGVLPPSFLKTYRIQRKRGYCGSACGLLPTSQNPCVFVKSRVTWPMLVERVFGLAMLTRFSSLILVLVVGGSVLAGTARLHDEHDCQMAGMETVPGMETMPCCEHDETQSLSRASGSPGQCCVNIPQEPGSSGTTFKLRPPAFSIAVIHPAVVQSPLSVPTPYECSYSSEVFLPNPQASYLRNLSLLI